MRKLALAFVLLICAASARAQTALTLDVHWTDGAKCSCSLTITQKGTGGLPDQMVFNGTTDATGHLATSVTMNPLQTYEMAIKSLSYGVVVFDGQMTSGFVTLLPLKFIKAWLVLTRPSVNGVALAPGSVVPSGATMPEAATGTNISSGI
jgi:hypothetical protein